MEKKEIVKKVNLVKNKLEEIIANKSVLTFNSNIDEYEDFFEEGMKARVIGYTFKDSLRFPHDVLFTLHLDVKPFEEHNDKLFKNDYYDKDRRPSLTAKEAGYYRDEPDFHISFDATENNIDSLYKMFSVEINPLYEIWRKKETKLSYVSWLEEELKKRIPSNEYTSSRYIDNLIRQKLIVKLNDKILTDPSLQEFIGKEVIINAYDIYDGDDRKETDDFIEISINMTLLETDEDIELVLPHSLKDLSLNYKLDDYFDNTNKYYVEEMKI